MQYDTTSLNSASDCNHTCYIDIIQFGNVHGIAPKVRRARKIYHLLSRRNRNGSNVQHLNQVFDDEDDSLALVPNVVASVQQYYHSAMFARHGYYRQAQPLSIMYEILRSWKMPQLYECRA